jgi:hypothetical protein
MALIPKPEEKIAGQMSLMNTDARSSQNTRKQGAGGMAQVLEYLQAKCKVLSAKPSTARLPPQNQNSTAY